MAVKILMPALSPTMTEGNIAKWLKKEGDKVSSGDILVEIETDKATMEVESIDDGILAKILLQDGASGVKVNEIIAILLEEGDSEEAVTAILANKTTEIKTEDNIQSQPEQISDKVQNTAQTNFSKQDKIFASPLARRIAIQRNIDLSSVTGSGPHGRIIKNDVESILTAVSTPRRSTQIFTTKPHSNIRKVIAKRLLESKQLVPHFYLSLDCNLDSLLKTRQQINDSTKDYKISVNDFIIKASAAALKKFPQANASWQDDCMLLYV